MNIKHIIFDWDGTLADTYPTITSAYKYTFQSLNLPSIPYAEIKRLTSTLPNKDTLGYIFKERKDDAKKAYYDYINQHHCDDLKAKPSAEKLLKFCRTLPVTTYLFSNKKRQYLTAEVNKLGFSSYFDHLIAAGDLTEDKPSSVACQSLFSGSLPNCDSILVIGDGLADQKVASNYTDGNKHARFALCFPSPDNKIDADFYIDDLSEIIQLLQS